MTPPTRCSPAATTRPTRTRRRPTPAVRRSGSATGSTSSMVTCGCHRRPARSSSPTSRIPTTCWSPPRAQLTDLHALGLLTDAPGQRREAQPLGYRDRMLPSFVLPPANLDDLRIAYGSCRRPGYDDGDALAWMDELSRGPDRRPAGASAPAVPRRRPDLRRRRRSVMMCRIAELGVELIGTAGGAPTGTPVERVKVGTVKAKKPGVTPDPTNPDKAYQAETPAETAAAGLLPAGRTHFPIGHRLRPDPALSAVHQYRRRQPPDLDRRVRSHLPARLVARVLG